MTDLTPTARTTVKRGARRADYRRETLDAIIDAALICHVAQTLEDGRPLVTPTAHWRDGDWLYWHGLVSARNVADTGARPVCVNLCLLDGLVLARSAFHHSLNYRSVTLFGEPEAVTDPAHKSHQLERFMDKVHPGRWPELRPISDSEIKATGLVRMRIDEASAKVRSGPPSDDPEDAGWPVWTGVIPIRQTYGEAIAEDRMREGMAGLGSKPD